ncbi:MAG: DUF4422 domain-containing protein [Ruminococcus flavefaciens]|nr:DUF4422 domain-containing protein [Ruminococcus flavefaciens]
MDLAIYGAKGLALGTYEAISHLNPEKKIRCFLVTDRKGNAESLSGIPVLELDEFVKGLSKEEKAKIEILIAVPEDVMPVIERQLEERGLHCYVKITSGYWAELMGRHYAENKDYRPLSALPVGKHGPDLQLYMAKFWGDKPLTAQCNLPEWIVPIQVGAALCKERAAELLDCDGVNISKKNGNYSELTALYWIWKNRLMPQSERENNKYCGLVHYRRILALTEEDLYRLTDNDVDVVLPYPMPYEPNVEEHHKQYLKDDDWKAVRKAVQELEPEYADRFPEILNQRYFYNYNIILAREEVLADYCGWLFPILERVEELSVPKGSERSDRYIGYVGETLETLYFMVNRRRLNILHAGCQFLT